MARSRSGSSRLSATERIALDAGTVWLEGSLFRGRPDWAALRRASWPRLGDEEKAFLDGPVEEVCRQVEPWRLGEERRLPREVWQLLCRERFFGLAIPREYGGRGFSPAGLSAVFAKLGSRSLGLSACVLIPNSVGPGELLLAYGTEEQKRHYLPRLARGEEIPCFALTEPEAGSDAASLRARAEVQRAADGSLALRLSWEKRYITLAPIATLLGLAVRLLDPEELLGLGPEPGITVVLVPTSLPGVEIGRYHDPMGIPFPNGPTSGSGVVVGVEAILGGKAGAGQGWRMLMEALAAGRGVSLPAQSAGGVRYLARAVSAYAGVRRQFGVPLAELEGVAEKLGEIAGLAYLLDAARLTTLGALEDGERPALAAAMLKLHATELARRVAALGMDVVAGAALMRGPRNFLADAWTGVPIGITVEGANLLTRTLIVFGQGALRADPRARRSFEALASGDRARLLTAALAQLGAFLGKLARLARLELSRGALALPPYSGPSARLARRLDWASARFAVLADLALLLYRGRLKRRERLTGRLADMLGWLYLGAAVVKRFESEGRRDGDRPWLEWAGAEALAQIQQAAEGAVAGLGLPGWLRAVVERSRGCL